MKKISKLLVLAAAAFTVGSSLTGCGNDPKPEPEPIPEVVHVTDVQINLATLDLHPGNKAQLTATVLPENASNKTVKFTSSAPGVATVSASGEVEAVAPGVAAITCSSEDNPAKFTTTIVTVTELHIAVESIDIGKVTELTLVPGGTTKLAATVSPSNATNKALTWSSNNKDVATVDNEGNVVAKALGQASISVQSVDNPTLIKVVTVKVEETVYPVTGVSISQSSLEIAENAEPVTLSAEVAPSNASNKIVYWESSNETVASVNADGVVTPRNAGTTVVKVTTADGGFAKECNVTVTKIDVVSFSLDRNEIVFSSIATGADAEVQLNPIINPSDATYKEVNWSSDNLAVATVDNTGLVKMVGAGTAVITAVHKNSGKAAICRVQVVKPNELTAILPIVEEKNYSAYLSNRGTKTNPIEEFYEKNLTYKVGDDNSINLLPQVDVRKGKIRVDQTAWPYDYEINVEEKIAGVYSKASASDYSIISAKTCELKFEETAIGKEFKVSITLGGYDYEDDAERAEGTAAYELEVIDGYNVSHEYELAYLDTTSSDTTYGGGQLGGNNDVAGTKPDYPAFKRAHGLDDAYQPSALILHKNMNITKDDVSSALFYNEEDASSWSAVEKDKSLGSLKDRTFLFNHTSDTKITLEGNYFSVDWSKIPLVRRPEGKPEAVGNKNDSHSSFFRIYNNECEIRNINIVGNAHAAKDDDGTRYAGGLIGFKFCDGTTKFVANNINEHGCYIGIMSEGGTSVKPEPALAELSNLKFFDNYNCFIYNWGGEMKITNGLFEGCGGPVVIQDHTGIKEAQPHDNINDVVAALKGGSYLPFQTYGYVSKTVFNDCQFNNYVIGTEAWFKSFGASPVAGTIKKMSDTFQMINNSRTFVYDDNHNGTSYNDAAEASKDCMMNLIVLNKSSSAQDMTALPVDGNVVFNKLNSETKQYEKVDNFNYLNPVNPTDPTDIADIMTRFASEVTLESKFRLVQSMNAPVIETAGGTALLMPDNPAAEISDMNFYPFDLAATEDPTSPALLTSDDVVTKAAENLALYFQGMMLVFTLGHYSK